MKTFYLGILILLLVPCSIIAKDFSFKKSLDYKITSQVAYPWSGFVDGWLGYGILLYGIPQKPINNFKDVQYGYIRPHLRVVSSVITNRLEARLDLYPISFLGVTVGQVIGHSALSILGDLNQKTGIDCRIFECEGLLMRSFIEAKLKTGYQSYFAVLFLRRDFLLTSGSRTKGFFYSSKALVGSGRSDELETQWLKIGKKINDTWAAGLHIEHNLMIGSNQHGYEEKIFANQNLNNKWSIAYGIKAIQTPIKKFSMGIGIEIQWNGKDSVEL